MKDVVLDETPGPRVHGELSELTGVLISGVVNDQRVSYFIGNGLAVPTAIECYEGY